MTTPIITPVLSSPPPLVSAENINIMLHGHNQTSLMYLDKN